MTEFRYPTPTTDPWTDINEYVPLLLAAVDEALDRPDVWPDGESVTAQGYIEDLKSWIIEMTFTPLDRGGTNADLSETGGAGHVLKQESPGAAITVEPLVSADIPWGDAGTITSVTSIRVNNTTGNSNLIADGLSGLPRQLIYRTSGLNRWVILANNTAEGVGNVGSDLQINRFDDNGANLGTVMFVSRSTGNINVINSLRIGGDIDHDGSNLGFYGTTPIAKPNVTGSRGGNVALGNLLTALANLGLITNSTT